MDESSALHLILLLLRLAERDVLLCSIVVETAAAELAFGQLGLGGLQHLLLLPSWHVVIVSGIF